MIKIEVIIPCRNACRVRSRIVVLKRIKTMVAEQLASLEGRSLVRVIIVKFPSDIAAHYLVNYLAEGIQCRSRKAASDREYARVLFCTLETV